ncbi:MAG: hypothetical protein IKR75_05945 [Fibrobacter sp.]|nr:hypothetical protein [Fibrobacter sp.]
MNKLKLLITCFGSVLLFVGCGDSTKVTGTSEETNELAIELSSSATIPEEESSSSVKVSSSSAKSSSSVAPSSSSVAESSSDKQEKSSSSSKGNTSTKSCSSQQIPSSSSTIVSSSSAKMPNSSATDASPARPNTLEKYIKQFGIDSLQFDNTVMASTTLETKAPGSSDTSDTNPPSIFDTEFGHVGLHPFVKANIAALDDLFPEAAKEYADLVTAIKNGNNECGLYLLNIYGEQQNIGHIAIDIQPDSITILDIVANNCKETTNGRLIGFLFSYCGEMNRYPELTRIPVEIDIPSNKCPSIKQNKEWVKENSGP